MKQLILPNKVAWYVDLTTSKTGLFLDEIKRKIQGELYTSQVEFEVLDSSEIVKLFFPLYVKTMMSRIDFRLDKNETERKIGETAKSSEYKLLWFCQKNTKNPLGGIIIHSLSDQMRVAYRCFDHIAARSMELTKIDYFAEHKMQSLARGMGYKKLCHGNDHHPVDQIGLSIYKLRVGAVPSISSTAQNIEISEDSIREMANRAGCAGYYGDPKGERYTKFYLYGNSSDTTNIFIKAAKTLGLGVERL